MCLSCFSLFIYISQILSTMLYLKYLHLKNEENGLQKLTYWYKAAQLSRAGLGPFESGPQSSILLLILLFNCLFDWHCYLLVSVYWGCCNIIPSTGWLKEQIFFFSRFSSQESPRPRCWQIRFLVRACFLRLAGSCLLVVCSHGLSSVCVNGERELWSSFLFL